MDSFYTHIVVGAGYRVSQAFYSSTGWQRRLQDHTGGGATPILLRKEYFWGGLGGPMPGPWWLEGWDGRIS